MSSGSAIAQDLPAYGDALQNGFEDWSWATHSLTSATSPHGGTQCISFTPAGWAGVFLHRNAGIDTASYDTLTLWVRSSSGTQNLQVALTVGGSSTGTEMPLAPFTGASIGTSWVKATIPFSSLGVTSGVVDGFWVRDASGGTQPTAYLDDITVVARTGPPPPPTSVDVGVDPNGTRRAISPLIYGVAHFDEAGSSQMPFPVRRWGGNATTRYNWEIDVSNHASDWFFLNIPNAVADASQLPNNSSADVWIDSVKAHQGEPALTVPMLGWVPKGSNPNVDRVQTWGYSVAKYGAQQQTECTASGNPPWCHADAGNGCTPDSPAGTCTFLAAVTDPTDTSKAAGPPYVTQWMAHIASRVGNAGSGGVKYVILDNEPMLWNSTHHDVHPNPVTYDEIWGKTQAMAAAIKAADPNVKILGPALWGWCAYWSSASDGQCSGAAGADYASHGNLNFTPWYLKQVADYQALHGVRLVDYLDWHFYPQAGGVFSESESAGTAALRLRTLKSLYDPTYVDESWIASVPVTTVNLIPRMRDWIAQYAPGTKIAINEYNFGDGNPDGTPANAGNGISSALAQGEALAIFGREGVDMANRWVVPPAGSLIEDAFKLYLNYDGAGAKVTGDSVPATTTNKDLVGAYAVRGPSKLYVLLFNKDTASHTVNLTVAGGLSATASLWRMGATHLASAGTVNIAGGAATLTLPARTATLAVAPYASTPMSLYTLAPCRLLDTRNTNGPLGGPALSAGVARTFSLAGTCGVPATAKALSVNVTAVGASTAGDYRLYAADLGAAPITSTINFRAGQVRANNAIVSLSADGSGSVTVLPDLSAGTGHVILDVNGYFQ